MTARWPRAAWLAAALSCGSPESAAPGPASWHVVLSDRTASFLCVWGTGPSDVFAVGGGLGNGTPSAFVHYDGARWHDLAPGGTTTFWWAHGTSAGDVWGVGEEGRIVHYDGTRFVEMTSGTKATLYGVWAAAPDDVWAVGGTPGAGASHENDIVLHFDGAAWSPAPPPQALGRAFFKVWGAAPGNLYVVGEGGTIWHRVAGAWTLESSAMPLAKGTLLTVAGCSAGEVYAVGARDVLRSDGVTWTRLDVTLENDANGVSCGPAGHPVVVGFGGTKLRLAGGTWADDFTQEPHTDLHGAWADGAGGAWAAGGDFVSPAHAGASRGGTVAYYGTTPPSTDFR